MAKGKGKHFPERKHSLGATKKVSGQRQSTDGEKIIWIFDNLDRSGEFAFDTNREDFKHREVLEKIIGYSNMTWTEVKRQTHDDNRSKHHFLELDSLSDIAKERVKAKHLEESEDSIFSFALQNKLRIIGIRENEKFHAVWYDPEHRFCPSKKKHT